MFYCSIRKISQFLIKYIRFVIETFAHPVFAFISATTRPFPVALLLTARLGGAGLRRRPRGGLAPLAYIPKNHDHHIYMTF